MDRGFELELVMVTELAAMASARLMGKGDERLADREATLAMKSAFDSVRMDGTIVIGKGEAGDADLLCSSQRLGTGEEPRLDVVLDPLEGTNVCATGGPNSLAVVAIGPPGSFLRVPEIYMEKIAVGEKARGVIDLDVSPAENLEAIAEAKNCYVEDLTVVILDRPRHEKLIEEVRGSGARIKLIGDGDVSAAIAAGMPKSGVDVLMGTGGAYQGVIAAAGLQGLGGDMVCRLKPRNEEEVERVKKMGIDDPGTILAISDLVKPGDIIFAATGVTDGDLLRGVRFNKGRIVTHSLVLASESRTVRFIRTERGTDRRFI